MSEENKDGFDADSFLERVLKAINNMSDERFREICIQSGYTPEYKFQYKPRKRRLRKKFHTHEFKESGLKLEFTTEQDFDYFVDYVIDDIINEIYSKKGNPEYPSVKFGGGVGGTDDNNVTINYHLFLYFPYDISEEDKNTLIQRIRKVLIKYDLYKDARLMHMNDINYDDSEDYTLIEL